MAVGSVSQREIVEVPYQLPDGTIKPHMFFVTHIVTYYRTDEVIQSFNNYVKKDYFDAIMNKVILSMFDIEIE
jgi:hypothetical protein